MNLYQKFYKLTKGLDKSFSGEKEDAKECEKIADEYAIQFARYVQDHPKIFNNGSSMKQALSLFKIENNL